MGLFDFLTGGSRKAEAKQYNYQPYSGYKPPRTSYLRPVEDDITRILRERSQDIGTGYNPKRRQDLQDVYDTNLDRRAKREDSDIQNRISGMGLSRNPAVYDELLGRARSDREADRSIYQKSIDAEDLGVKNQEKREATQGLQRLNEFNFGQENNAADFDFRQYMGEQGNQQRQGQLATDFYGGYEDPTAAALSTAYDVGKIALGPETGGVSTLSPNPFENKSATNRNSYGSQTQDPFQTYLQQLAAQNGKNLTR